MQEQAVPQFAAFGDYRPTLTITVVVRWVLLAVFISMNNYRVDLDSTWLVLNLLAFGLAGLNAYMTWGILQRRRLTWVHALIISTADLGVITAALYVHLGFQNDFYVFYYPALLGFSLLFPGRPSFAMVLIVVGLYILMAFTVTPTLNTDFEQEKLLIVRVFTMVGMTIGGTLINGWERGRRRDAVEAEQAKAEENLQLERRAKQAELEAAEERNRIAREIHDGIAQSIYMLSLQLETCADLAQENRKGLTERLGDLVNLSKKTLLEVRYYIFDLKPYLEGAKGMVSMVENQVKEFNKVSGIPASLDSSGEERPVKASVATCLYRVTQESLANVLKHAHATRVEVNLEFLPGGAQLLVHDDGQGFDTTDAASGYGLANMRRRVEELEGTFSLQSSPGAGTEVVVRLPC